MQNLAIFSLFILLFSSRGCKEKNFDNTVEAKNIQVPAYTETGANTLGCFIDGKPWTVFGQHFELHFTTELKDNVLYGSITKAYYSADSVLKVNGSLGVIQNGIEIREEGIRLSVLKKSSLLGAHYLSNPYSDDSMEYSDINYPNNGQYTNMARNPIKITINKDMRIGPKRIISGNFEGYLYNNYNKPRLDSIHITGGVFDIDLSTVAKP